jgi:hypothetical protein
MSRAQKRHKLLNAPCMKRGGLFKEAVQHERLSAPTPQIGAFSDPHLPYVRFLAEPGE